MATSEQIDLGKIPLPDLEAKLECSESGLTRQEAAHRLAEFGPNELPEKRVNPILQALRYFWGPIPWMIEAATILSIIAQHWADAIIILALLFVNAGVGFWEEYQAGNTIASLKARLALQARVLRDGAWASLPARDLVPGDLIRLRLGDIIAADARIISDGPAQVDQSFLTGESLPVSRATGDILYSGAILKQGEVDALVYATGANTYFGRTARLTETAQTTSHFQRTILKIGDYLIVIALVLVTIIIAVALFRGDNMLTMIEFALVLTVAAIPVAMPTVLSITMAVGARTLAAMRAIVTRLAAIEELAGIDVLCSDKTGTLTQNKLTLGDPFVVAGASVAETLRAAALASRAEDQDPIDLAVLEGARASSIDLRGYQPGAFQPFDPVSKRTEATLTQPDGQTLRVTKGAPQVILDLAQPAPEIRERIDEAVNGFATRGYRSLGVASAAADGSWRFLGILPLYDPPREDSRATLDAAAALGVQVKMITGDQLAIARETARSLGMGQNIVSAQVFSAPTSPQSFHLAQAIEQADGFAEVFPEHKYHIVETLQQRGHIVGMTGDGVNDAPALRKADAGIAVSGAADAARAAAAIVSLAPGLSVIISAIRESRKIFQRMNSYAIYRIAETLRVVLFMTLSIVIFNFYPVTPVMIVLLALLNDGAILSIAYDNVRYSDKPESWDMALLLGIASVLGVVGVIESFGLFYITANVAHLPHDVIQSIIYLKLSVAGHLTVFVARTRGPFWSIKPAPILLGAVLVTQLIATLIAVLGVFMTPIGWGWALVVWGYALVWFLVEDQIKLAAYRIFDHTQPGMLMKRP